MSRGELLRNLSRCVDRRIHGPKEHVLCVVQSRCKVCEPNSSDDHQIDVARSVLILPSDGAIDKGDINAVSEPFQALGENIC